METFLFLDEAVYSLGAANCLYVGRSITKNGWNHTYLITDEVFLYFIFLFFFEMMINLFINKNNS